METLYYLLIILYFMYNCFRFGYMFYPFLKETEKDGMEFSIKEKFMIFFVCIHILLFTTIADVLILLSSFFKWINKYLQPKFYFEFYFTKKYSNLSNEELKRLNNNATIVKNNSNEKWIKYYLKRIDMINKRNGFY